MASLFGKTEDAELSSFKVFHKIVFDPFFTYLPVKSMSNTKIELPFWLAHSLVEHSSVEITDMPRCFRYQSLQAVTSAAENVKLRDYSPYYYRIGCIVIEELESVVTATIRRILVETFKKRLDLIFSKANAQRVVLFHQARQEPGNSGAKSIKNSSLGSMIHNPNTISVVSSGSGIVGASATGILSDFYESLDDLEKLSKLSLILSFFHKLMLKFTNRLFFRILNSIDGWRNISSPTGYCQLPPP